MPGNRKNFAYFTYVDDNATTWNLRGEDGGAGSAVDGHAAFTGGAPVWGRQTKRRHPRYVVAQDPVSFRTVKFVVYTQAAYNAIAGGDTIAVSVPGSGTAVNYNVSDKIPEKQPIAKASNQLID